MLLAIAVLFALPIVAAGILRLSGRAPQTTANYGTLLTPRPMGAPALAALRGKWVLLQFDGGACSGRCQEKLYYMRQVRRAQGANAQRVERLWVVTDSVAPRAELLAAIAGTRIAAAAAFPTGAFPANDVLAAHIWLVDPMGNLMLRFPREPDPGRMVKDLERLLKYSGIG
jgi:cytochrome oxidase Cu insertion factor (SCO1/SenC/PrrC family)